jgi:hypothetical protein
MKKKAKKTLPPIVNIEQATRGTFSFERPCISIES